MNLYSHVTPSMQREAADKIGAALFAEDFGLRCDCDLDAQLDSWTPDHADVTAGRRN